MSPMREQLIKLAHGFLDAFNTNTPEGSIAFRSANCQHRLIPESERNPVRTNAEFQAFIAPIYGYLKNLRMRLADDLPLIVDEEARRVIMYVRSSAESPVGPYANQYVFMLRMNSDATEIEEIVEFYDTAYTAVFVNQLVDQGIKVIGD